MSEDDFRKLYQLLAESYVIDPETAERLLERILRILAKCCGEENKNEVL